MPFFSEVRCCVTALFAALQVNWHQAPARYLPVWSTRYWRDAHGACGYERNGCVFLLDQKSQDYERDGKFEQVKKDSPAIILIGEINSIAPKREKVRRGI